MRTLSSGAVELGSEFVKKRWQKQYGKEDESNSRTRKDSPSAGPAPTYDNDDFAHVAVWEHKGEGSAPQRHKEELAFENVKLATRSYK